MNPISNLLIFPKLNSCLNIHHIWLQKPGEIEAELAKLGTRTAVKKFLTFREPEPWYFPKGKGFHYSPGDTPVTLPPWLSEEDIDYFTSKLEKTSFSGGINYYRALHLYVLCPCASSSLSIHWQCYKMEIVN